jgi:succinyl-diaminopimelate desuccinylase
VSGERLLTELLDEEVSRAVDLCTNLVRIPSENPPGDTREIASFLSDYLRREGVEPEWIEAQPGVVNLVATFSGRRPGRHVVFNGHMDTFPVGERQAWTMDPFGGTVTDGRLYGRGAADMKGGVAACTLAFILLHRVRDYLSGKVSICLVSDEETGSRWGAKYLLETRPDLRGDALLNAEPSGPANLRVGEKGMYWFRVGVRTRGGHSAYARLRPSAIREMMGLLRDLIALEAMDPRVPLEVVSMMEEARSVYDDLLGPGATDAALSISVNVGTIRGGTTVNMVAESCEAEVDFRLPPGPAEAALREHIARVVREYPNATVEEVHHTPATLTEPSHPLVTLARSVAEEVTGHPVPPTISLGGTDARLWRLYGVPAVVYGPRHHNMGSPDEYILVDDLGTVVKVHALTAFRYLCSYGGCE